jgi:hypothetical protein
MLAATYRTNGWDHPELLINTGTGYMLRSSNNTEMVLMGTVQQGAVSYNIPPGYSTLANRVAKAERFPGHTLGHNGDALYPWDCANQTWGDQWEYMTAYDGWVNTATGDTTHPDGPLLQPGEAIYYQNSGNGIVFTRSYSVDTPSESGYQW